MKKTVKVVVEKEYEIDINDSILTQESVSEFELFMWELDGGTLEEKQSKLFEFAASQLAQGEEHCIEGLGKIASVRTVAFKQERGERVDVVWDDTYDEIETEVMG